MNHSFLRCAIAVSFTLLSGLASFTGGSNVTSITTLPESAQADQPALTASFEHPVTRQSHTVSMLQADPEFVAPYTEQFLQDIRSGANRLSYTGAYDGAKQSLSEIISYYCADLSPVPFYDCRDAGGTFLEIEENHWKLVQSAVAEADEDWKAYSAYVYNTARSFDLNGSDQKLVDQINEYICDQYDYEVTNAGMPSFVRSRQGQCWHYAKLFEDLCHAVGIEAVIKENEDHAWNEVTIGGITYSFDVTYNDIGGSRTAYSWYNPTGPSASVSKAQAAAGSTGWVKVNNAWRYLDAKGKPVCASWIQSNGKWYYFRSNGDMLTSSWVVCDGRWSYLTAEGTMASNTWINGLPAAN